MVWFVVVGGVCEVWSVFFDAVAGALGCGLGVGCDVYDYWLLWVLCDCGTLWLFHISLSLCIEFCAGFVFVALLLVRFYSWAMGVTVIVPFPSWCESLPVRWVVCTVTSRFHSVRSGVMDSRSFSGVRAWNVPLTGPSHRGKPSM